MKPLVNDFSEFQLDQHEDTQARAVSASTYTFIQNKVAAYAKAVLEYRYDPEKPLQTAIIEHEILKGQVTVLQELMRELLPPIEAEAETPESQASHS